MKPTRYLLDRNDDSLECFSDFCMHSRLCREFCAIRLRCLIERDLRVPSDFFDDDMFTSDEFSLRTQ